MTQLLSAEKQNMLVAVQSVDPHLHKFALAAEPTVFEQSEDSQPLAGEPSMSYFPAPQEDSKVHVDASEQATHVLLATEMALQSNDDSQPLATIPSLSYLSLKQEQHWSPLSVHQVQTVVVGFADCVEEEQLTASPAVLFLPQFPQVASKLQVSENMPEPGYAELPPALEIQVRSSFDLKLNAFAL